MQVSGLFDRVMRKSSQFVFQAKKRFDRDFSPLFICGIAGSGTTLLSALLDQRYQVAANVRESARWSPPEASIFIDEVSAYPDLAHYALALPISPVISAERVKADCIKLYQKHIRWPKISATVLDKAPNTHLARAHILHEAFPDAKFLLIVRDPVANIEGLRRKWPIFADAEVADVCGFWQALHEEFITTTRDFAKLVMPISYTQLVQDTDAVVTKAAEFDGLSLRATPFEYQDTRQTPGKGLRNVQHGKILVDKDADASARVRISAKEEKVIRTRLGSFYKEMEAYCSRSSLAQSQTK